LVFIILSQMTTHHSFNRVFNRLRATRGWGTIASMPIRRLTSLIKDAGLSKQKAPRIKAILRQIKADFGDVTLEPLRAMSDADAYSYLIGLPGVGEKSAKCVLMYSLKRKVLPVDTHGLRVSRRLGLVSEDTTLLNVHHRLEVAVPRRDRYSFHVNVIEHGRKLCLPFRPRCPVCPLKDLCPYGRSELTRNKREPTKTSSPNVSECAS
jgi:endonuclease-3